MASVRTDEQIAAEVERWRGRVGGEMARELASMGPSEIAEAFYRDLSFGTGGLRGKIGVGPNRINALTVARATRGLADYLRGSFEDPSVVICRDTRLLGEELLDTAASVLASNGVRVFKFGRPEPTPLLSFAVRELGCSAGVNITASHNPAEYNGYKVYGSDGCQITVAAAAEIQAAIDATGIFEAEPAASRAGSAGLRGTSWVPEAVVDRYVGEVLSLSTGEDVSGLGVAYTPLHGVGLECVSRVLEGAGVGALDLVEPQLAQDGRFPTCPVPNPEEGRAMALGMALAGERESDLLIATDPDADRLGVAVRHGNGYVALTGNETGLLLLDFLAERAESEGRLGGRVALTTVVSAPMADAVARDRGFELRRTLTGFKFIGEQIGLLEREGRVGDFLMGFEESYGYLAGSYTRDKDAVVGALHVCELAAHWKARGLDLVDALAVMEERYGCWSGSAVSVAFEGPEGARRMDSIMAGLRSLPPAEMSGVAVADVVDYLGGAAMPVVNPSGARQLLPPANMVELRLDGGSKVIFRPSGTEPKVKCYVFATARGRADADRLADALSGAAAGILGGVGA